MAGLVAGVRAGEGELCQGEIKGLGAECHYKLLFESRLGESSSASGGQRRAGRHSEFN